MSSYRAISRLVDRLLANESTALAGDEAIFLRRLQRVREQFDLPGTTITAAMARFLFTLSRRLQPRSVVALGSYVGVAAAFLLADTASPLTCVDCDAVAMRRCQRNLTRLGVTALQTRVMTAERYLASSEATAHDLIWLDIDDPVRGKSAYADVVQTVLSVTPGPCWLLYHDTGVEKFAPDMRRVQRVLHRESRCRTYWSLDIDPCGIGVAQIGAAR